MAGIFYIYPVRLSKQPQGLRRAQKHGVTLSRKFYQMSLFARRDIFNESKLIREKKGVTVTITELLAFEN